MKKISTLFIIIITAKITITAALAGETYYLDAANGNDFNSGTAIDTPWKTIAKVNSFYFNPGDEILFKRGQVWREQLVVPSSGSSDDPITFGAYGSGNKPVIKRSYLYNNWWQYSLFYQNAGFELLDSGKADDLQDDNFTWWYESIGSGGYIRAVSDSQSGTVALKMHRNTVTSYIRNSIPVIPETVYYLDLYAKLEAGSADGVRVRIRDMTNNFELQDNGSWLDSYNELESFSVSGSAWAQRSIIFTTQPGASLLRIDIMAAVNNTTCYIDDVYFSPGIERSPEKIWVQYYGVNTPQGIMDNGILLEKQGICPPEELAGLKDGKWERKAGYIYYRKDEEEPLDIEVGTYPRAIEINSKDYIVIDSIDAFGPYGQIGTTYIPGQLINISGTSSHITIKNSEISFSNSLGIWADSTTSDISYEGLDAHENSSTGIYMNSQGGSILNSKSYDNGRREFDKGDRGGIGSYQGGNIIIKGNEIYNNGQDDQGADMEISVVEANNPVIISGNYVHDCIQGCIQVAAGSNNSVIAYNIINSFSTTTAGASGSAGSWAGIRVGGGTLGVSGVKIYNNVIHGGGNAIDTKYPGSHAGLNVVFDESTGLEVKNNIFSDNAKDVYINYNVGSATSDWDFNNNIFYKADFTDNWYWKGSNCHSLADWQNKTFLDANSLEQNPLFCNGSGGYSTALDFYLQTDSPCIDKGLNIGLTADFLGLPVPYGATPDIGAYEYISLIQGDIDGNGDVDISDLQLCVNVILGVERDDLRIQRAKEIAEPLDSCDVLDVQAIVNIILG